MLAAGLFTVPSKVQTLVHVRTLATTLYPIHDASTQTINAQLLFHNIFLCDFIVQYVRVQ